MDQLELLAQQYRGILGNEKKSNWERGMIAVTVTELHSLDKKAGLIDRFLTTTGESKSLFNSCRWVVEAFQGSSTINLQGLSWSHFRAAAGSNDPEGWVQKAYDNGWGVKALVDAIVADKDDRNIEKGVQCKFCEGLIQNEVVGVSYKRKRSLFCSKKCAIDFLLIPE